LLIEGKKEKKEPRINAVEDVSIRTALCIGLFQALSIVPGTSRSGSTILGSMLLGLSRTAGAEFSFFMAIPAMVGAGGIKTLGFLKWVSQEGFLVPFLAWLTLAIGFLVSFLVSSRTSVRRDGERSLSPTLTRPLQPVSAVRSIRMLRSRQSVLR
jgi:undecaprenyl-diphosphatase